MHIAAAAAAAAALAATWAGLAQAQSQTPPPPALQETVVQAAAGLPIACFNGSAPLTAQAAVNAFSLITTAPKSAAASCPPGVRDAVARLPAPLRLSGTNTTVEFAYYSGCNNTTASAANSTDCASKCSSVQPLSLATQTSNCAFNDLVFASSTTVVGSVSELKVRSDAPRSYVQVHTYEAGQLCTAAALARIDRYPIWTCEQVGSSALFMSTVVSNGAVTYQSCNQGCTSCTQSAVVALPPSTGECQATPSGSRRWLAGRISADGMLSPIDSPASMPPPSPPNTFRGFIFLLIVFVAIGLFVLALVRMYGMSYWSTYDSDTYDPRNELNDLKDRRRQMFGSRVHARRQSDVMAPMPVYISPKSADADMDAKTLPMLSPQKQNAPSTEPTHGPTSV
ncbi:hypothetical protein BC831DRAFT_444220 [Entophlyctis helioformis]|nr:hypothetical protein BC831DRAFT_444220 [Entophlyctis helioformis]